MQTPVLQVKPVGHVPVGHVHLLLASQVDVAGRLGCAWQSALVVHIVVQQTGRALQTATTQALQLLLSRLP